MKFKALCCFLAIFLFSCQKDEKTQGNQTRNAYLSDRDYDKLIVEVETVSGSELTGATINNLMAFLEQRLNKPAGIQIMQNTISSPGKNFVSFDEIRALENSHRSHYNGGNTAAVFVLVLDAEFAENVGSAKVLGLAYGGSSICLFEKTIRNYSGGLTQPSRTTLESTVFHHEFGHTLGLVNNGSSMVRDHQDRPHGRHCNNPNCLMYYAAETSDIVGNLIGNNIPELDQNCINDLRANGGK
jgi:hypothetical protein